MKFSYKILPERRLNVLRYAGAVSVSDVMRVTQEFWADERFNPEFNGIVDLEATTTRAKVGDLKSLLDFLESNRRSTGWWVAILTDPKTAALAIIFKAALNSSFRLEIVNSWEAACKFLQIDFTEDLARI
jgi:hypothetical protein